jgi:hypothetical protein
VAEQDCGFGKAFGAGGADVVGGKFFDYGDADHAGEDRG